MAAILLSHTHGQSLLDVPHLMRTRERAATLALLGILLPAASACAPEGPAPGDLDHGSEPGANPGADLEAPSPEGRRTQHTNLPLVGSSMVYGPDFVAVGIGGLRYAATGPIVIGGISGLVKQAFLYWHGPTATNDPAINAQVQLNGRLVPGTSIGFSYSNNWPGYTNSQAYIADVTAYVSGNGTYTLTGHRRDSSATTNGASLLVFYDDGNTANDRTVTVLRGNDSVCPSTYDGTGFSAAAPGLWYDGGQAFMQLHVADGQAFTDAALRVNGQVLAPAGAIFDGDSVPWAGSGTLEKNSLWDLERFDISSVLAHGTSAATVSTGADHDCIALVAAAFDLPAKCPWGGAYDPAGAGGAGSCRYTFDAAARARAARYAVRWATSACPLFCAFQFSPYVPAGSPAQNYACAAGNNTDCANFVSQALLYAGLPMTKGWYCDHASDPVLCVRGNAYVGHPSGWAGADRSFSGGGMPKYFGYNLADAYDTYRIVQDPSDEQGLPATWDTADTAELRTRLQSDQAHNVTLTAELLNELGITQGDIMVTNGHDPATAHVLLVVGWGPRVKNWKALDNVLPSHLTSTWTKHSVPYVIDHGLHQVHALTNPGAANAAAMTRPKPYYATRWNPDGSTFIDNRHFIALPDSFSIPYDDVVLPTGTEALRQQMESTCPAP